MALPIHTGRLIVRECTIADLDELAAIYAHPEVLWWEPAPYTREQTQAMLELTLTRYGDEGMGEYAVVLETTGELVGVCGPVYREVEGERLPELGWDLRRESWGRGYATEAARAVLPHAAGLGLRRVYSLIDPANARSQGVARRLGMTVERRVVWADRPHDLWALDLAAHAVTRVAAYVLREGQRGRELLVFAPRGLRARVQVPAGRLRAGEDAGAAVLREVLEETGLDDVAPVSVLGTQIWAHFENGGVYPTVYFELTAGSGGPGTWEHTVGGEGVDRGMIFDCRWEPLPLSFGLWARTGALLAYLEAAGR